MERSLLLGTIYSHSICANQNMLSKNSPKGMKVARATQEEEKSTGAEVAMGLGNMVKIHDPHV